MRVNTYTTDTFKRLSPVYGKDTASSLISRPFYTEQGMHLSFCNALSGVSDVKINNFSALFLSKKKKLDDYFRVDSLTKVSEGFSTFLAFNSVMGVNTQSVFWSFDEDVLVTTNGVSLTLEIGNLDPKNRNFFEIEFINEMYCRITHSDKNITRYLTLDYSANLSFAYDFGYGFLGLDDPQTFVYFYDRNDNLLVLYKKVFDLPYYVTYSLTNNRLALIQPALGPGFPFPVEAVIRTRPHTAPSERYRLQDFSAHYTRDSKNNTLNTSTTLSVTGVKNNTLISFPYSVIEEDEVSVDVLTLKNEQTPFNTPAQKDPYISSTEYTYRDYHKLFTGTHQLLGDDNISIGFDAFTHQVHLKPNALTFFHIPNDIYPFTRINVNDSLLIEAGAIAADHPVKADKIFKKRADNKYYTYFGNASDENNGQFLCSWLSAASDVNTRPVWVDRYYQPSRISFYNALTANNNTVFSFDTTAESIFQAASSSALVFDKPSDLYFEPGVYYMYHHIGNQDIATYLKTLSGSIVQSGLINYYVNNTNLIEEASTVAEYAFDGQQYSKTISLDQLSNKNSFTVSFELHTSDWEREFGNQIFGNYTNKGLGLFNQTHLTSFYFYYFDRYLYVLNTAGAIITNVIYTSPIKGIWRKEDLQNYAVLLSDGKLYTYDSSHTLLKSATLSETTPNVPGTFYTNTSGAVLVSSITGANLYHYSWEQNTFNQLSPTAVVKAHNIPLSSARSTCIYNTSAFALSSSVTHLLNGKAYYLSEPYQIRCWALSANTDTPFFSAATPIRDFNIDFDSNFWILQDQRVVKYTSNRQYLLSAVVVTPNYQNARINFSRELPAQGWQEYAIITQVNTLTGSQQGITIKKYTLDGVEAAQYQIPDIIQLPLGQNITNDDYTRRVIGNQAPSLILKALVNNIFGTDATEYTVSVPTSALDSGYHHIATRFDNIQGEMALFVDGVKQSTTTFDPGSYIFSESFNSPLVIGAPAFFNNTTLPQYTRDKNGYVNGCKLRNWVIYDGALLDSDIRLIGSANRKDTVVIFNVPAGRRHLIDEVERYFTLNVPSIKDSRFVLCIKNSGITNTTLQAALEQKIADRVTPLLPFNSGITRFKWID